MQGSLQAWAAMLFALAIGGCIQLGPPSEGTITTSNPVSENAALPIVEFQIFDLDLQAGGYCPGSTSYQGTQEPRHGDKWTERIQVSIRPDKDILSHRLDFRGYLTDNSEASPCLRSQQDAEAGENNELTVYFLVTYQGEGTTPFVDRIALLVDGQQVALADARESNSDSMPASTSNPTNSQPRVAFSKDEQGTAAGGILTVVSIENGPIGYETVSIQGSASCSWTEQFNAPSGNMAAGDQLTCTTSGSISVLAGDTLLYSGSFSGGNSPQVSFSKDETGTQPGGILTVVSISNGPVALSSITLGGSGADSCSWSHGSSTNLSAGDQLTCTSSGTISISSSSTLLYSGQFA